jgi:hypothetical protein
MLLFAVLTIGVSAAFVPTASAETYPADRYLDYNECTFGGSASTDYDGTITYSGYYNCAPNASMTPVPKSICARLYRTSDLSTPVNLTCRPAGAEDPAARVYETGWATRSTNAITSSCLVEYDYVLQIEFRTHINGGPDSFTSESTETSTIDCVAAR